MSKYPFIVFFVCALSIVVLGVVFLLTESTTVFLLDDVGPTEYRKYGGKEIILMGASMVALGIFLKWKHGWKKDKPD